MIPRRRSLLTALLAATAALVMPPSASAHGRGPVPAYDLPEDGVRLEGIGVDGRSGAIYVSATNRDGTIYRALPGSDQLAVWVGPRVGDTGRGIAVDAAGRVFVAGGPTGRVRIFTSGGALVADLATGVRDSFLNDVWVTPDGTAYVTDSALPIIWRVTRDGSGWALDRWLDTGYVIPHSASVADFELNGIVATPGGQHLIAAQTRTGQLWRITIATKAIEEIIIDGPLVPNADGIALRGDTLYVIQNFSRQITTLALSGRGLRATTVAQTATPSTRTFTTAKLVGGQLLAVDSTFGLAPAPANDRVVSFALPLG